MSDLKQRAEEILLRSECGETTWSEEYRRELKAFIVAQFKEVREEATGGSYDGSEALL